MNTNPSQIMAATGRKSPLALVTVATGLIAGIGGMCLALLLHGLAVWAGSGGAVVSGGPNPGRSSRR
jgi:hypothetical protein